MEKLMTEFVDRYVIPLKRIRRLASFHRTDFRRKSFTSQATTGLQKLILLLGPFFDKQVNEDVQSEMKWTEEELCNQLKLSDRGKGSPICKILKSRLCTSAAAPFIDEFNGGVDLLQEEKGIILNISKKSMKNAEANPCFERENDIVDDMIKLLETLAITAGDGKITLATFLQNLNHLRLCDSKVGSLDIELSRLDNLTFLILSGNLIEELPIDCLPCCLRVLELCNNIISNVNSPKVTLPPLLFLGLSSNCFSDSSVMEGIIFMKTLRVLDLSDNNISTLPTVLNELRKIPDLMCLCLKGNPCSTLANYKNIIKEGLPTLQQLDGIMINAQEEKERPEKELNRKSVFRKEKERRLSSPQFMLPFQAVLKIIVFRIMGVPKPTQKHKKGRSYFQFEVELPLLDDRLEIRRKCHYIFELLQKCDIIPHSEPNDEEPIITEPSNVEINKAQLNIQKSTTKIDKIMKKKEDWEIQYEEFLSEDKEIIDAKKFVSEKLNWSTIMKPTNPIVVLPVEQKKLSRLRDTLRSIITVRFYYKEENMKFSPGSKGKTFVFHRYINNLINSIEIDAIIDNGRIFDGQMVFIKHETN